MTEPWIPKITLNGNTVTLRPLSIEDEGALAESARDGLLWELTYTSVPENHETRDYIEKAINNDENGRSCTFVVVHKGANRVIGSTRFTNLDPVNKRLEIGYTWYAKSYQRTAVNKECKLLLLSFAFEQLNCLAVEFRTHHRNTPSQKAIEMLGAKFDGILRNHQIDRSGQMRNTMVYSITDTEWPDVKERLKGKIEHVRLGMR